MKGTYLQSEVIGFVKAILSSNNILFYVICNLAVEISFWEKRMFF